MAVKCRDRRIFRPDNFSGTQVSTLDPAATKNAYIKNSPRTDLFHSRPHGTPEPRNLTQS